MAGGGQPWKEGNYKGVGLAEAVLIQGSTVTNSQYSDLVMTFTFGEFGEANEDVAKASGQTIYNVRVQYKAAGKEQEEFGVVSEDGLRFTLMTFMGLWKLEWITKEEAEEQAKAGDPIDAPPNNYKVEPERQGKLIWLTGAPGLGKSTTAQLLSKDHCFVFYETDCFFGLRNPYIPTGTDNPSLGITKQRKLVGEGAELRRELAGDRRTQFGKAMKARQPGELVDLSGMEGGYRALCEDVARERRRIGGDWAVAGVLFNRQIRDFVRWLSLTVPSGLLPVSRSQFGPELQIVVLDMAVEDQMERLRGRHGGDVAAVDMFKVRVPTVS